MNSVAISIGEARTAQPSSTTEAKVAGNGPVLVLSLCLVFTVALVVGLVTGILSRIDAATLAKAVMCGGAAFGTTLLIGIALIAVL
ncbi:hypothetical protein ACIBCN_14950 [Nocardia sp. NPDC051052]|uniref:hypothetical protein n=1 Tax=Nocardia sp. NPDC051052 TaxID=3364322 RepID=UPI0037B086EA